eukprot:evm.model.scf_1102.1 EVM.evm.TU.scf_1102.1   scf_1102:9384-10518(-)
MSPEAAGAFCDKSRFSEEMREPGRLPTSAVPLACNFADTTGERTRRSPLRGSLVNGGRHSYGGSHISFDEFRNLGERDETEIDCLVVEGLSETESDVHADGPNCEVLERENVADHNSGEVFGYHGNVMGKVKARGSAAISVGCGGSKSPGSAHGDSSDFGGVRCTVVYSCSDDPDRDAESMCEVVEQDAAPSGRLSEQGGYSAPAMPEPPRDQRGALPPVDCVAAGELSGEKKGLHRSAEHETDGYGEMLCSVAQCDEGEEELRPRDAHDEEPDAREDGGALEKSTWHPPSPVPADANLDWGNSRSDSGAEELILNISDASDCGSQLGVDTHWMAEADPELPGTARD